MAEPPAAPTPYVFLSYASADREQALAIADTLTATGLHVWLDRRSLVGGMSWDAAIVRAIKDCTVFAVLCTPASVASPNVMQELRLAWEEQRPTVPLLLAAVSFPDEMRYILAGRQWVEVLERSADAWLADLHNALSEMGLVASRPPSPVAAATPVPVSPPTNLPVSLTSFVGREAERTAITELLTGGRLVTLTGVGGSGKTRLALEVAAEPTETFADGVVFVDLAPLRDPELVPAAIAGALGIEGASDLPLLERFAIALRDRSPLLLLDNFEHLLPAAAFVPRLLQVAPGLTVLATSRAPLRVRGERAFPVDPLAHPEPGAAPTEALAAYPAVMLFVQRAHDARPDFVLSDANAAPVAEICRRLDGLPLALELAAARVRHLSVEAIAARLDTRLALLTGGPRDVPQRQQTLRDTIAWSDDLLPATEQRLFRRLAVFAGGCTLAAAAAVCDLDGDRPIDTLDGLAALVDAGLLQRSDGPDGEPRFRQLETVREYAEERLAASGEADAVRRRHAAFFVTLAEEIAPRLRRANRFPWLPSLDAERDNLRAVQAWSRAETDGGEAALRLAGALWHYWSLRGAFAEGRQVLTAALALPAAREPGSARAAALLGAAFLAREVVDLPAARSLLEACVRLGPELGGPSTYALALAFFAPLLVAEHEFDEARRLAEESRALARSLGDPWTLMWATNVPLQVCLQVGDLPGARAYADVVLRLGRQIEMEEVGLHGQAMVDMAEGQFEQARTRFTEVLALARARDFAFLLVRSLGNLALLALRQGELQEAAALFDACIDQSRRTGMDITLPLTGLGWIAVRQDGRPAHAVALFAEALSLSWQLKRYEPLVAALGGLARVAVIIGDAERAVRLLSAAEAVQATLIMGVSAYYYNNTLLVRSEQERTVATARETLGEAGFASAWAAGAALPLEAAVAEALGVPALVQDQAVAASPPRAGSDVADGSAAGRSAPVPDGLTAREVEVLRLLAAGKSNRAIADALFISLNTVERHINHLFAKTGAANRVEAATYAHRQGLAD